jgi:hypothetical protein
VLPYSLDAIIIVFVYSPIKLSTISSLPIRNIIKIRIVAGIKIIVSLEKIIKYLVCEFNKKLINKIKIKTLKYSKETLSEKLIRNAYAIPIKISGNSIDKNIEEKNTTGLK